MIAHASDALAQQQVIVSNVILIIRGMNTTSKYQDKLRDIAKVLVQLFYIMLMIIQLVYTIFADSVILLVKHALTALNITALHAAF